MWKLKITAQFTITYKKKGRIKKLRYKCKSNETYTRPMLKTSNVDFGLHSVCLCSLTIRPE